MSSFITTGIRSIYPSDGDISMCIYKIENTVNGKIYIGLSKNSAKTRWATHISNAKTGRSYSNSPVSKAIKKYGISNFTFSVVDYAENIDQLNTKESFWISHYNSLSPCGYNLVGGGGAKGVVSEETRKRHSAATRKSHANPSTRYHTEEYKATRSKIILACLAENPNFLSKALTASNKACRGKKHSDERRKVNSESQKGVEIPLEQKISTARGHTKGFIIQCSNGKTYLSAFEAQIDTGIPRDVVCKIYKGVLKPRNNFNFWKVETPATNPAGSSGSELNSENAA